MASSSSPTEDGALPQRPTLARRPSKREPSNKNMNGPLYMQGNAVLVRRIKRKNESPMKQFTRWFVNNQTGTSSSVATYGAPPLHQQLFSTAALVPQRRCLN